ncbi:phage tail assembly chaperone G [Alkalihalophilus marmarensis]|uniref:Phage tail assembly chaperone protein, TAC n=1 Tax=Alkalihalophilus marmarensis DSM 21297 TaxID=1188261 RepID=U6SRL9_9BACI|nr:hypothetical protein [Alkalihalophilus marmarensis]ERN54324.1 hypothetical protein A33I_07860 [Alkalihalophilus marmarensis DSM 21297]
MLKLTLKFPKKDENGNVLIGKGGMPTFEKKTYANAFFGMGAYKRTLEIQQTVEDVMDGELTDEYLQYICEMYNHQFTIQDLYEGLPLDEFFKVFQGTVNTVINKTFGLDKNSDAELGNEKKTEKK